MRAVWIHPCVSSCAEWSTSSWMWGPAPSELSGPAPAPAAGCSLPSCERLFWGHALPAHLTNNAEELHKQAQTHSCLLAGTSVFVGSQWEGSRCDGCRPSPGRRLPRCCAAGGWVPFRSGSGVQREGRSFSSRSQECFAADLLLAAGLAGAAEAWLSGRNS